MKAARDYPILTVTAKGTRWLESGHPWVYDSDVAREPDESECETARSSMWCRKRANTSARAF